jgi:hypothetical protein
MQFGNEQRVLQLPRRTQTDRHQHRQAKLALSHQIDKMRPHHAGGTRLSAFTTAMGHELQFELQVSMSALSGWLNGWTQHFNLLAKMECWA